MTENKIELNLPSILESVDKAASEAESFARQNGFGDEALFAIDMAVREAVANAIKHGNKQDADKFVEVTYISLQKGLEVTVRDFGEGFEVEDVPDPTNPENLLKANGRGVLFMKTFMEEVEWIQHQQVGMIVKMCKLR